MDAAGRVVGLNTSGLARDARLVVPATTVTRVADELLRTWYVSRGYLGLGMEPSGCPSPCAVSWTDPRDRPHRGDGGARRTRRARRSLARRRAGGARRRAVSDLDDVQARLGSDRIGVAVPSDLVRAGARTELSITVGTQPRRRG